ncbi:hypothetical protein [Roseateles sp.]|uniref:hypothetical protein n=1 Tax=Roseateles sp. TaxID=1971397 RepID=UPI002F40F8F6
MSGSGSGGHWHETWRRDCERVGLAGTSVDLVEIKRTYAATLRKTRPEDDAQAYQALREAYDRVVAHARHEAKRARAGAEADTSIATAPVASGQAGQGGQGGQAVRVQAAPANADEPSGAKALCDWLQARIDGVPAALPQRLEQLRREALDSALPELQDRLARLPLSEQPEASVRLADLLLRHADIAPGGLVHLLHRHFAWIGDFRAERLLGRHRISALTSLLERELALRPLPLEDAALEREYGSLGALATWLSSPRWLDRQRAKVAIIGMGHGLAVQLSRAGPTLLRQLGVSNDAEEEIRHLLALTNLVAWALMSLIVVGALYAAGFTSLLAFDGPLAIAVGGLVVPFLLFILYVLLGVSWGGINATPVGRWIQSWSPKYGGWLAMAGFIAAGAVGRHAGIDAGADREFTLLAAQILAGTSLMLAFSHWGVFLATSLTWLVALGVLTRFSPTADLVQFAPDVPAVPSLWMGVAAAWVTLGGMVLTRGFYEPQKDGSLRPQWPQGGIAALLLMGTIGLPTGLSWLAVFGGHRLIVGGFMLAVTAVVAAPAGQWQLVAGPVGLFVGLGLLVAVQRAGWWIGRRLMARRRTVTA